MNARILFYSSVASKKQFVVQEFYRTDIRILRSLGHTVLLSNHWYDFLAFWRYDVAFIYFYRFGLIPALIARLSLKRVFFSGGIDYLDREFSTCRQYWIQAVFYNLCGIVSCRNIIVSESDMRNCERVRWLFPDRRQVLSKHSINPVPFENVTECQKEKLVLTVAWMSRVENVVRKGILESLGLFQQIAERDPEFRMLIVGARGDGSIIVENRIREMGLVDRVFLTGSVSEREKVNYFKRAAIYLQLSRYEGFGIAAIEALAAGCLVVHSGAGGLSEGVGQHGIVWRPGDQLSVVSEIFRLLEDQGRYERLIKAGRDHVARCYSIANRTKAFAAVLG